MTSQSQLTQPNLATQATQNQFTAYFGDATAPELSFTATDYLQFDNLSQSTNGHKPNREVPLHSQARQQAAAVAATRGQYSAGNAAGNLEQLRFEEGYDEDDTAAQELSEFACAYCHIDNPACVVKCLATGKWFCNAHVNSAGSCIILHLVKSKNKEVQLHKDSPLGDTILECYASGSRNVFVLGFVPVKSENTVVLLARDTPSNHPAIKELDLDLSQWAPIVEERGLVSWLVKVPSEKEVLRARHLTLTQVTRLEELWKAKPDASIEEVEAPGAQGEVTPVALKYKDVAQYVSVFEPLVKLEADYDRSIKEAQGRDNITVRWNRGLNQKWLAMFNFPRDDAELKLMAGDELKLKHKRPSNRSAWEAVGHVITYVQLEEVVLELNAQDVPEDCTVGYSVEFVWKGTTYDRMRTALSTFRKYSASISGYLYHTILGDCPEPASLKIPLPKGGFNVPSLPELNHSQLHAVKSVLTQPLSLIQGPPGTGKTVTSAAIVYHLAQSGTGQVLVAAPSNVAVDQLAAKIDATGLKVVRVCAKAREAIASPVEHLTLHYQVQHLAVPEGDLLRKLLVLQAEQEGLMAAEERQLKMLRRKLEMEILDHADVVCCTCVGAGHHRLANSRFQHVLIDESTQAAESECLIPLVLGAKQVVLVGDHCQLGPVIMCKKAAEAGLSQSMFERLRLLGVKPIRLQVQYRMHPCLSEFPSNMFYEGTLQNGMGVGDRVMPGLDFPWPNPEKPMMFYVQLGAEEMSGSGTSFLNRAEASNVEKVVTRLLQNGLNPSQIGVITPYEGQRAHVVNVMVRNGPERQELYKEIEVSSVDAFQGREKDIIVLSCVRSNEQQSIGFLSDPRRLNVALTRARYGLIILGNPRVLSKQPLWNSLLGYFKEHGCLVEGPLGNLKQSMVQLHKPRREFDRSSFGVGSLTTNRYQPPEYVGEPLPGRGPATSHADSGTQGSTTAVDRPIAAGAALPELAHDRLQGAGMRPTANPRPFTSTHLAAPNGVGTSHPSASLMPFGAPAYTIPAVPRASRVSNASFAPPDHTLSQTSQGSAAIYTQAQDSHGGLHLGAPLAAGTSLSDGAHLQGTFSQASYVGVDDYASQADVFMLSQGFNEIQFLDAATGEVYSDMPTTQYECG